ncbi:hypothetical protein NKI09_09250 [Mesorhizobium sp. M0757]|uniref:antitoxin Xre/MbcA/ParS-like domain-containing protein n=1 Tax=Mesorhizobium sp. M0757 TaxID=2956993 RepID=UPI00333BE65D
MTTRRRFSKKRHKEKLESREGLAETLYLAVESVLQTDGPKMRLPAMRAASEIASIVVSHIVCQTDATQRAFKTIEDDIAHYAIDFAEELVQIATGKVSKRLIASKAGRPGPGAMLQLADDWAGPVAGPTEIERFFGIPRSTLYRWQKRNEAIALNTRTGSKPVFPLRQFADGRPLQGIHELISIAGSPRLAWEWLIAPSEHLNDQVPIDVLHKGPEEVIAAAKRWKLIPQETTVVPFRNRF